MELLTFPLRERFITISSALYPEGISEINKVVLAIVPHDYESLTPVEDVMSICKCEKSLVFMTAARKYKLKDLGDFYLFMSAGIGRSGEHAGRTINVGVFLRRNASINAMVDMVRTITEAKCSFLMKIGITGTASDATAVGISGGKREDFMGPSTDIGRMVSREVIRTLAELLEG